MENNHTDTITTADAATICGVCIRRMNDFAKEGRLPARKHGRTWIFIKADVEAFAAKPRKPGKPRKE